MRVRLESGFNPSQWNKYIYNRGITKTRRFQMSIRTEVREVEKHIKAMTSDKMTQIHIISKAQSFTLDNEHNIE